MSDKYPGYNAWPEIPGLAFVLSDGHFLCCECANRKKGSRAFAATDFGDEEHKSAYPKGNTDDQWRIVGAQMLSESEHCSHCQTEIRPTSPAGFLQEMVARIIGSKFTNRVPAHLVWVVEVNVNMNTWRLNIAWGDQVRTSRAYSIPNTPTEEFERAVEAEVGALLKTYDNIWK